MRKRIGISIASLGILLSIVVAPTASANESAVAATSKKKVSAVALLNKLDVAPENRAGYERDLFRHWITVDGCDTRQWVLIRQREQGSVSGCTVENGTWYSPYDGVTVDSSRSLDIDHMVPLAEAWDSGASQWSADQRTFFANDLEYKPSLLAVTASTNRSKGDKDPAEWMPPLRSDWCTYLKDWVGVKTRWDLSVDPAEKAYIKSTLRSSCSNLKMKRPPLAPVAN